MKWNEIGFSFEMLLFNYFKLFQCVCAVQRMHRSKAPVIFSKKFKSFRCWCWLEAIYIIFFFDFTKCACKGPVTWQNTKQRIQPCKEIHNQSNSHLKWVQFERRKYFKNKGKSKAINWYSWNRNSVRPTNQPTDRPSHLIHITQMKWNRLCLSLNFRK